MLTPSVKQKGKKVIITYTFEDEDLASAFRILFTLMRNQVTSILTRFMAISKELVDEPGGQ